jgi:hypothetical protein
MSHVVSEWTPDRPRWGTFSVRAHTDTRKLITDMLLYDVLVFPSPSDDPEVARWNANKWNVELLATRVVQLGDHAVVRPWDDNLRRLWMQKFEAATAANPGYGDELAFDLTAHMMAEMSFIDLLEGGGTEATATVDHRTREIALHLPDLLPALQSRDARPILKAAATPPELVAAFQHIRVAQVLTGTPLVPGEPPPGGMDLPDRGLRLRLEFAVPEDASEDTFIRTLTLLDDGDFQQARRRLWSWEKELSPDMDLGDIAIMVEALLADYNETVRRAVKAARMEEVFLLVPVGLGIAMDQAVGGVASALIGAGTSVLVDKAKLKFPALQSSAAAAHHPGGAIAGALAVVAHH